MKHKIVPDFYQSEIGQTKEKDLAAGMQVKQNYQYLEVHCHC
ncbi:hypothetical protein SC406_06545 [Legionella pneumophila serogroup 1]